VEGIGREEAGGLHRDEDREGGDRRNEAGGQRLAAAPAPSAFDRADGPNGHLLARQMSSQKTGQLRGCSGALRGVLLQTLEANAREVAWDTIADGPGVWRVHRQDPAARFIVRVCGEGDDAGEELVEDYAQGVNVATRADGLLVAAELLGRHVEQRPRLEARGKVALGRDIARQAEVGDARFAGFIEQDILRLQVAMEDAAVVGVLNGLGKLEDALGGRGRFQGIVPQALAQSPSGHEIHREVGHAVRRTDLQNPDDSRVAQPGHGKHFAAKSFARRGNPM
jgi:hypothetical protein